MKKRKYALVGYPLGHSMSQFIHTALFQHAGIAADYSLMEISPDQLASHMGALKNLDGANVTIPHKTAIIPYLTRLDDRAALYGAVNTIVKVAVGVHTNRRTVNQ